MHSRTPVIVGSAQLNHRDQQGEPIELMCEVGDAALADSGAAAGLRSRIDAVRAVGGIWPYRDPAAVIAGHLGRPDAHRTLTVIGGNEVYDLVNDTAQRIAAGEFEVAIICSAETGRTRRAHQRRGEEPPWRDEPEDATPDECHGSDQSLVSDEQRDAGLASASNFYAMAEIARRHRIGESPEAHLDRIADLWAGASHVASQNPHAWLPDPRSAADIATPGDRNRPVAHPYPKLMTSNIDVDQAAALVLCSTEVADAVGVSLDRRVFPLAGSGAHDPYLVRTRWALDRSAALRIAGSRVLELAGRSVDDCALLDLYSCFPAAVQVGREELGIDETRPFTVTGGLTFAGGPLNSYCLHALARSVELLREDPTQSALLSGNGGYFTKHSFLVLGGVAPTGGYVHERPQAAVDAEPTRPLRAPAPGSGTLEAYTVTYDRAGTADRAILSVLDREGARTWAATADVTTMEQLQREDACGRTVELRMRAEDPVPVGVVAN